MKTRLLAAAAAAVFVVPAAAGAAPVETEGTWAAWYGCWRVQSEGAGPVICLLPGESPTSVRIATLEDGAIASETTLHADGVTRPVHEGGCTGEERAWFSSDGRRVFTRAELNCNGMARVSTGVMGMISENAWVDAQSMSVGAERAARAVEYRLVHEREVPAAVAALLPRDQHMAQESARLFAAAPLDIQAVIEMSRAVEAQAAEALLAARGAGFGLNGSNLVQLADAGVPRSTIDMMVALSHPQRFAVATPAPERTAAGDARAERGATVYMDTSCRDMSYGYYRMRVGDPCFDMFRYGYGVGSYGYRYSPWGYDPYYWNVNRPVVVIVRPTDPDGERIRGEVVKGRGYTRTDGDGRGPASPRPVTPSSTNSGSSNAVPSSSTSGSSSNSGSEKTRTAKPRGNNN